MKKIIILLTIFLAGCSNDALENKKVSDSVIEYLKNGEYTEKLDNEQKKLIDDFIVSLNNPEVNVNEFIVYNTNFETQEENSKGIYIKDNQCHILYNDIIFGEPIAYEVEPMARLVCNGYVVAISESSISNIKTKYLEQFKNEYRFLGYYENDSYNYVYRSYYEGNEIVINVSDKISIQAFDENNIDLKPVIESNNNYIFPIIISALLIGVIIFLKKVKDNNDVS